MGWSPVELAGRIRARIESKGHEHGLVYPWWIAVVSAAGQTGCAVFAVAQRGQLVPPSWVLIGAALVLAPHLVQLATRAWLPWWAEAALVLGGMAVILAGPGAVGPDFALPAVGGFLAAHVTAGDGFRRGAVTSLAAAALLLLAGDAVSRDAGAVTGVLVVIVGLVAGYTLRWQMRALAAEREARAGEAQRAALAERQRIAREIHDLVAHSLSVTMLHVTGARQVLEDPDPDLADAAAALTDAERVGRQAMAEIRRTVSVLGAERADVGSATDADAGERDHPLPCAEDVPDLVAGLREAGHPVSYRGSGDLAALPPAAGLGLYQVLQESLTNAARHAPSAPVEVLLDVDGEQAHLRVRNRRTSRRVATDGSGTAGMRSRAEQLGGTLRVGPDGVDGGDWLVELAIPSGVSGCAVRRVFR